MDVRSAKLRFGLVGRSKLLDQALDIALRVAPTDLTVLISGESGVGKEAFSKIIHQDSPRKHNNFISINCGAIPAGTINSELFGHEKGAFTGATQERKGYFETVNGGSIFLDEIGEMPLDTQAFLLRVLETGEFIRVGSSEVMKTDVRVIAATNVDLIERVNKGKFREDLYFRLNTVPIHVPSLKERREDILLLFTKFAQDFAEKYHTEPIELDPEARRVLENYGWPGNIRELRNLTDQLSVLSESKLITVEELIRLEPHIVDRNLPSISRKGEKDTIDFKEREILYQVLFDMKKDLNDLKGLVFEMIQYNNLDVPNVNLGKQLEPVQSYFPVNSEPKSGTNSEFVNDRSDHAPYVVDMPSSGASANHNYEQAEVVEESLSLEQMEKEMIAKALKKHKGRRKDAAEELGISERTLYRKIKQYELEE